MKKNISKNSIKAMALGLSVAMGASTAISGVAGNIVEVSASSGVQKNAQTVFNSLPKIEDATQNTALTDKYVMTEDGLLFKVNTISGNIKDDVTTGGTVDSVGGVTLEEIVDLANYTVNTSGTDGDKDKPYQGSIADGVLTLQSGTASSTKGYRTYVKQIGATGATDSVWKNTSASVTGPSGTLIGKCFNAQLTAINQNAFKDVKVIGDLNLSNIGTATIGAGAFENVNVSGKLILGNSFTLIKDSFKGATIENVELNSLTTAPVAGAFDGATINNVTLGTSTLLSGSAAGVGPTITGTITGVEIAANALAHTTLKGATLDVTTIVADSFKDTVFELGTSSNKVSITYKPTSKTVAATDFAGKDLTNVDLKLPEVTNITASSFVGTTMPEVLTLPGVVEATGATAGSEAIPTEAFKGAKAQGAAASKPTSFKVVLPNAKDSNIASDAFSGLGADTKVTLEVDEANKADIETKLQGDTNVTVNAIDKTVPVIFDASVSKKATDKLKLTFTEPVTMTGKPSDMLTLTKDGSADNLIKTSKRVIRATSGTAKTEYEIELTGTVASTDTLKLTYTSSASNKIVDAAGNALADISTAIEVANRPVESNGEIYSVKGLAAGTNKARLYFDEPIEIAGDVTSKFAITGLDATTPAITISSAAVSTSNANVLELTLSAPLTDSKSFTVKYNNGNDTTNYIKSVADASKRVNNFIFTKSVGDTVDPTLNSGPSITTDGTKITLTANKPVLFTGQPFTVRVGEGANASQLTDIPDKDISIAVKGQQIELTLPANTIYKSDTVKVAYENTSGGKITDLSGNEMATITSANELTVDTSTVTTDRPAKPQPPSDTTAPTIFSAYVPKTTPNKLKLIFDEDVTMEGKPSDMLKLTKNGATNNLIKNSKSITRATSGTTAKTEYEIELEAAVDPTDTLKLSYTSNGSNKIVDVAGNTLANIDEANAIVVDNSPVESNGEIYSVKGESKARLYFDEPIAIEGDVTSKFTITGLDATSPAITISSVAVNTTNANVLELTLSASLDSSKSFTVKYNNGNDTTNYIKSVANANKKVNNFIFTKSVGDTVKPTLNTSPSIAADGTKITLTANKPALFIGQPFTVRVGEGAGATQLTDISGNDIVVAVKGQQIELTLPADKIYKDDTVKVAYENTAAGKITDLSGNEMDTILSADELTVDTSTVTANRPGNPPVGQVVTISTATINAQGTEITLTADKEVTLTGQPFKVKVGAQNSQDSALTEVTGVTATVDTTDAKIVKITLPADSVYKNDVVKVEYVQTAGTNEIADKASSTAVTTLTVPNPATTGVTAERPPVVTPPTSSVTVTSAIDAAGKIITLTTDKDVTMTGTPFTVKVGAKGTADSALTEITPVTHTALTTAGKTITLTLPEGKVFKDDVVKVEYVQTAGTNEIKDGTTAVTTLTVPNPVTTGVTAERPPVVTPPTDDKVAPVFKSASVNRDTLTITFDKDVKVNGTEAEVAKLFTVKSGTTPNVVKNVTATGKTLKLTLTNPILTDKEKVTVEYTGKADATTDFISNVSGQGKLAPFAAQNVTINIILAENDIIITADGFIVKVLADTTKVVLIGKVDNKTPIAINSGATTQPPATTPTVKPSLETSSKVLSGEILFNGKVLTVAEIGDGTNPVVTTGTSLTIEELNNVAAKATTISAKALENVELTGKDAIILPKVTTIAPSALAIAKNSTVTQVSLPSVKGEVKAEEIFGTTSPIKEVVVSKGTTVNAGTTGITSTIGKSATLSTATISDSSKIVATFDEEVTVENVEVTIKGTATTIVKDAVATVKGKEVTITLPKGKTFKAGDSVTLKLTATNKTGFTTNVNKSVTNKLQNPTTPPTNSGGGSGSTGGGSSLSDSSSTPVTNTPVKDEESTKPGTQEPQTPIETPVKQLSLNNIKLPTIGEALIFGDVPTTFWANSAISKLSATGVINGMPDGSFNANGNSKRADVAVMLTRLLGLQGTSTATFTDVPENAYYANAVGLAKEYGIINGTSNGKFNPNGNITRQDTMVMIARILDNLEISTNGDTATLSQFSDTANVSSYAVEAVAKLVNAGIINGNGGKINPKASITRAEIAVIMDRIYGVIETAVKNAPKEETTTEDLTETTTKDSSTETTTEEGSTETTTAKE